MVGRSSSFERHTTEQSPDPEGPGTLEGQDREARIARGPLPVEEAMAICRQVAEGLEASHDVRVVHRDLKLANVLLTPREPIDRSSANLLRAHVARRPEQAAKGTVAPLNGLWPVRRDDASPSPVPRYPGEHPISSAHSGE